MIKLIKRLWAGPRKEIEPTFWQDRYITALEKLVDSLRKDNQNFKEIARKEAEAAIQRHESGKWHGGFQNDR